jgi:hypothetical protein
VCFMTAAIKRLEIRLYGHSALGERFVIRKSMRLHGTVIAVMYWASRRSVTRAVRKLRSLVTKRPAGLTVTLVMA